MDGQMSPSKPRVVVGLPHLDALVDQATPSIEDYCRAAAEYVTHATTLDKEYVDDFAAYEAELVEAHVEDDEDDPSQEVKPRRTRSPSAVHRSGRSHQARARWLRSGCQLLSQGRCCTTSAFDSTT